MTASHSAGGRPRRVTTGLSLFLVAIGAIVLAGWSLDLEILKGLGGSITMKANAAIGLLATGLSLRLFLMPAPWTRPAGRFFALLAGTIGALTLSEHLFAWNLGIDELLFEESPGAAATTSPGRMGPNASTSLTLASIAIWSLYSGTQRAILRAQILGTCIAILALVPIVGYMYGATQLYAVARYSGIALHTGVALLALSMAILGARSEAGPVAALTNDAAHGVMARQLLTRMTVLTLLLGYARMTGERLGWYDTGFGIGIFVVVVIVLFSITTWHTAVALERSNRARERAQKDRDDLLVSERTARERAERADRAKDEFIAALSHELRTPLNAMVGWMQMLQHGTVPESGRARAAEAVSRNAAVLMHLIEDLLDTSRIATGHLELARVPVDVNGIARAAVESVTPAAHAKGVNIVVNAAPDNLAVTGDAQRLQQVLWNLVMNAVKFSPPGGTVTVDVARDADAAAVSVGDQGEGIEPAFLPRVFDRFQQASGADGSGGLGLGLHIARHLVERHGGTIRAHSDGKGHGAVFTVHLPMRQEGVEEILHAPAAERLANVSERIS